jgi:hypothetical protein
MKDFIIFNLNDQRYQRSKKIALVYRNSKVARSLITEVWKDAMYLTVKNHIKS